MNDFLDRVTAKAIGNEAMLAPRLPSLFEPQAAPIMPATFETSAFEEQRNARATQDAAEAGLRGAAIERSPTAPEPQLNEAARKHEPSQPDAKQRPTSSVAPQAAIETTSSSPDIAVDRTAQPTTTERTRLNATPREPVQPRVSRVARESLTASAMARPADTGVLLPPAKPVFVSTKNLGDLPARAAEAMHLRSVGPTQHRAEQSEPIVHVSIGRLEVRAAPNNATTPTRRNDAPRPSSLDDYLRERGKAVP
ncbi:hypothetical protein [Rhodanobacter sp. MP7CTX1]|uniref:hypothetical protein n=1 Tax=Rhodanobacter sp. MP7CTX1 TaxID=2723084 RepID=UPI0016228E35|nr:hypothetical protein [Rhodanobacter sp. MP7CTX1]MBB6187819.1 hypothetical protein [Rhodanobacter sp. MP7CTX1]